MAGSRHMRYHGRWRPRSPVRGAPVFLPPLLGGHFPGRHILIDPEETMKLRQALQAPAKLATAAENATVLAVIALIVAGVALIIASQRIRKAA